jgi:hypothetical protein
MDTKTLRAAVMLRASNRVEAIAEIRTEYPRAKFFGERK